MLFPVNIMANRQSDNFYVITHSLYISILIYVALIYVVQFGITDILYVTECKINYGHHGLGLFHTLTDMTVSQACQHDTSQSLLSGNDKWKRMIITIIRDG